MMPRGGGGARAEAIAVLKDTVRDLLTATETGDLLAAAAATS